MREQSVPRCGIVLADGGGRQWPMSALHGEQGSPDTDGEGSPVQRALRRAERLMPSRRVFTVVGRDHWESPDAWNELAECPGGRVVVQPAWKETAPEVLLSLAHLSAYYPNAAVAIFPADLVVMDETAFLTHVEGAYRVVERRPTRVVLLGAEPAAPAGGCSYVMPGAPAYDPDLGGLRQVTRFVEQPTAERATMLARRGGLWNTFVLVFRADTMWAYLTQAAPMVESAFRRIRLAVGTRHLGAVVDDVYRRLPPLSLSALVLQGLVASQRPSLTVLAVGAAVGGARVVPELTAHSSQLIAAA